MLRSAQGIRLYDGDSRTDYDDGVLLLTSHRLVWTENSAEVGAGPRPCLVVLRESLTALALAPPRLQRRSLQLNLAMVSIASLHGGHLFLSSPKIQLDLYPNLDPKVKSEHHHVKLSFRHRLVG